MSKTCCYSNTPSLHYLISTLEFLPSPNMHVFDGTNLIEEIEVDFSREYEIVHMTGDTAEVHASLEWSVLSL